MGKVVYIHQDDKLRKDLVYKPKKRWILWFIAVIAVLAVVFFSFMLWKNVRAKQIYKEFDKAWIAQNYEEANKAFENLLAGATAESGETNRYEEWLRKSEDKIRAKREDSFIGLKNDKNFTLDGKAKEYFLAFAKYNEPYVHNYLTLICHDIMGEKINADRGREILANLEFIPNTEREIKDTIAVIPEFANFSEAYKEATMSSDIITQAKLFKKMADSVQNKALEAIKKLFNNEYKKIIEIIQTEELDKLELGLAQGKYYTVQAKLPELATLIGENPKFKALQQRLQELSLPDLVPYNGEIYAMHLRPLVRHPEIAMSSNLRKFYMQNVLPAESLEAILTSLHERGFVLVNPVRQIDKTGKFIDWQLPAGKKPLVLVINGMDYGYERSSTGSMRKLLNIDDVLQSQFHNADGSLSIENDADVTGVVENFVKANPDFAFDGARGVISLTGYKSIFGYITTNRQLRAVNAEMAEKQLPLLEMTADELKQEQRQAQAVANKLKANGWEFASLGYDLIKFNELNNDDLLSDIKDWNETMQPILGEVEIFNFSKSGAPGFEDIKLQTLFNNGFKIFLQDRNVFAVGNPNQPLIINMRDVNPLNIYFGKLENLFNCKAAYKGILHAKMYDPPKR